MATDAENLETLRAVYTTLLNNILDAELAGASEISVDGVTINMGAAYDRLERLAKIPGVAPANVFTIHTVAR